MTPIRIYLDSWNGSLHAHLPRPRNAARALRATKGASENRPAQSAESREKQSQDRWMS